ncbi:MAG: hypothetical protein IJA96_04020 [Alistipes sp.]|nr:hypothetical protein [Alistipes sp.]
MDLNKLLDAAIKKSENGSEEEVYITIEGKAYENYMSNEKWVAFLKEMNKEHLIAYMQGYGNEISEKQGRYGIYPPKMASYGSSSRMIYKLLKTVEGIHFEKQLPTKVGGTANLDGYLQRGETEIFIEAKCREIYTKHANIDIKEVYDKVLEDIKSDDAFHYTKENKETKTGYLNYSFSYSETPIVRFDIKQLICHFLGIAANYIENKSAKNKICFIYLIYNPKDFNIKELKDVYDSTIKEIKLFEPMMNDLFNAIFDYQKKALNRDTKAPEFEFKTADQSTIEKIINSVK